MPRSFVGVILAVLMLLTLNPSVVRGEPEIHGQDLTRDFPELGERASMVWDFVQQLVALQGLVEAPYIYIAPFELESQSKEWTKWQRSWIRNHPEIWVDYIKTQKEIDTPERLQQWARENGDDIFPFPKVFLAFHYDGTNRIQINPFRTFYAHYVNDPYGIKRDFVGSGYYSTGHEMLHYALEVKGILPTRLHHCIFVKELPNGKPALLDQLAEFLINTEISAPIIELMGPGGERKAAPCSRLSDSDLRLAEEAVNQLGLPNHNWPTSHAGVASPRRDPVDLAWSRYDAISEPGTESQASELKRQPAPNDMKHFLPKYLSRLTEP